MILRKENEKMKANKIYQGNSLDVLKTFPDQSIDMAITSPPYWALRDFQTENIIWDCDCEHEHNFSTNVQTSGRVSKNWNVSGTVSHRVNSQPIPKPSSFCSKCHCEHEWNEPIEKKMTGGTKSKKVQIKGKDNFMAYESESNFCSKCPAWKGQFGLEPNFDLYIKHLCDIFEETKRVLKDEGTLWVNLGDTYAGSGGNASKYTCGPNGIDKREHARPEQSINRFSKWNSDTKDSIQVSHDVPKDSMNVKNKSLIGIPFRFTIEMIIRGWILRNTLIWHKNNVMPSSVKDRFTVDFEYIFFFSKNKKYYFQQQLESIKGNIEDYKKDKRKGTQNHQPNNRSHFQIGKTFMPQFKGRNKRTVWKVNTKPFKEAHFAVFPEALIETPILAGCPEFICKKCSKPKIKKITGGNKNAFNIRVRDVQKNRIKHTDRVATETEVKNYNEKEYVVDAKETIESCNCNAGFDSGIVLDMFMGSGTTGLVALKNNRRYVGIELNKEYIDMAEKRLSPYKNKSLDGFQDQKK